MVAGAECLNNLDPGPFLEAYIKCLNAIIITQPVQSSLLRVSVMPRRKGNQLKASRQQRNAGGQFSNNRELFEVGDDVSEAEVDEIDDLDCRERGWHSEQDDNGSESDDPSCDEFDEESVCSQDHDFSRDEDFQTAISAVDSTSEVHKKGYYVDGHERDDVVADRDGRFLPRMAEIEKKMSHFEDGDLFCIECEIEPHLPQDEKRTVLIAHDESIFYSNECSQIVWLQHGQRLMRPKSKGRSLHVSGFCCPCHGFIGGNIEDLDGATVEKRSFKIITPGEKYDGFWKNSDLVKQLREDAIPLFKLLHPGCKLVFMFDNSSNHHAREPGTASADQLNLSDGGKNVVNFKDTTFRGLAFAMQHVVDGKLIQKGVKTILIERDDWDDSLILDCSTSKPRNYKHAEEGTPTFNRCCGRRRLSLHEDFQNTKCWLEAVMDDYEDCELIFLPKFHCELNFIERIWGYCKAHLRRCCTFRFDDLQRMLPETLLSVPQHFFRRAARSCFRWMSGYREGLTGPFLDFIMKKYTSHRCIPKFADQPDLQAGYEQLFASTQPKFSPSGVKVEQTGSLVEINVALKARMKDLEKPRKSV